MQDNNQSNQFYNLGEVDPYASTAINPGKNDMQGPENSISWTASEFIYHEKATIWYVALIGITLLLATTGYFLLGRDLYTLIIIILLGLIFGIAGARRPRVLQYLVDDYGLLVDKKHFDFESFKSFSILDDNPISSLVFMPTKRLGTVLTIYVPEEQLDEVTNLVSMYLPIEQHQIGYADKFLNKIKF